MSDNDLSGREFNKIVIMIRNQQQEMRVLKLAGCNLTKDATNALAEGFKKSGSIESFDLSRNKLNG